MKSIFSTLALCGALGAMPAAHAVPVLSTFSGAVSSYWSLPIVADDLPLGTAASWSFTFDNSFAALDASQLYLGMSQDITGALQLGSSSYSLSRLRLTSYAYNAGNPNGVGHYGFWVQGSGPDTDDGEPFSGLWIGFNHDVSSLFGPNLASFGNVDGMVANNGYAFLTGQFGISLAPNEIPLPPTLWLAIAALALLRMPRRWFSPRWCPSPRPRGPGVAPA